MQRMFPETQLWWGWGGCGGSANRSQLHLTELQNEGSASLTRDSASTGQRGGPASCQTPICSEKDSAVPNLLSVVNTTQCQRQRVSSQVLINLDGAIVCPLAVIKIIIMDCLFCLWNTDAFNLAKRNLRRDSRKLNHNSGIGPHTVAVAEFLVR